VAAKTDARVAKQTTPEIGYNKMTFHIEDIVEEIATKRQGKLDAIDGSNASGKFVETRWRVYFADGEKPLVKLFLNKEELRLVKCPHEATEPGFYPSRSILEP
jgi:hypothetical protein